MFPGLYAVLQCEQGGNLSQTLSNYGSAQQGSVYQNLEVNTGAEDLTNYDDSIQTGDYTEFEPSDSNVVYPSAQAENLSWALSYEGIPPDDNNDTQEELIVTQGELSSRCKGKRDRDDLKRRAEEEKDPEAIEKLAELRRKEAARSKKHWEIKKLKKRADAGDEDAKKKWEDAKGKKVKKTPEEQKIDHRISQRKYTIKQLKKLADAGNKEAEEKMYKLMEEYGIWI